MNKVLLVVLVIAILGALGYIIATPKVGERFTEFYVLGTEGKAVDYPRVLVVGKEGRVVVGIVNRERETIVSFMPNKAGDNQKVEFLLYKNEEAEPHSEPLYILINVTK